MADHFISAAQAAIRTKAVALDAGDVVFSVSGKAGSRVVVGEFAASWSFVVREDDRSGRAQIARRPGDAPAPEPEPAPVKKRSRSRKAKA